MSLRRPILPLPNRKPIEITITIEQDINDAGISAANRRILRQIQGALGDVNQALREIYNSVNIAGELRMAWQFCQITAAMLESSDDADGNPVERSVLTTASESPHEFNWLMAGGVRGYKVVLGPGAGVPSHYVIIDKNDANMAMQRLEPLGDSMVQTASPTVRPYGMTGLKIQFGQWKPRAGKIEFWPTSVAVGTWVYLEQTLPQVNFT